MFNIKKPAKGLVAHGLSTCPGCGLELIMRNTLEILGENTTLVIPPGCSALFCGYGKESGILTSAFQGNLENTAAYASGIRAGYEVQGKKDVNVVGFAGDGATIDIGLQSLSGMIERGEDVLYICYDNEAYMNTGIQSSSSTPKGSWTTTTPGGKRVGKKDLVGIAIAHDIPYAATATIAYMPDLRKKLKKAKDIKGPRLLHIHCPCPTGWRSDTSKSVEIARLAVQTGAWILYEYEDEKIKVNIKPKNLKPIEEYFNLQRRFSSIEKEELKNIQNEVNKNYQKILEKETV